MKEGYCGCFWEKLRHYSPSWGLFIGQKQTGFVRLKKRKWYDVFNNFYSWTHPESVFLLEKDVGI